MTDRRTGSVGVTVDLKRVVAVLNRQTGGVGVTVDLVATAGAVQLTVSTTQSTQVRLAGGASLARTLQQSTTVSLASQLVGPISVTVAVTVGQTLRLQRAVTLGARAVTQAQVVSGGFGRGFQRVVTAIQTQAVSLRKTIQIRRALTGSHRVSMRLALGGFPNRQLRITRPTSVRLVRQIRLTRAITQGQSVGLAGVPVQLQAVATIQTRSLALGLAESLTRAIGVAQASWLERFIGLERTVRQPTVATREQGITLTREAIQATSATLEAQDVTPFQELVVSLTVSQSVALSMVGTGQPARGFVVLERDAEFVIPGRRDEFVVARRGVRFTLESR